MTKTKAEGKTVKTYQCKCGEDFYEDDVICINCGVELDKSKLKEEEIADIKKEVLGQVKAEDWEKAFIEEFGIHFKGSKGELQFAIAFITKVRADMKEDCIKVARKHSDKPMKHDIEVGCGEEIAKEIKALK